MVPVVGKTAKTNHSASSPQLFTETASPTQLTEQNFHLWLRTLYAQFKLQVAPLVLSPDCQPIRSTNHLYVTSTLLDAGLILQSEHTLRAAADIANERTRAWQRTEARTYDNVQPTYRAHAIHVGEETLRLLVEREGQQSPAPLLSSTAILRTTASSVLEIAETTIQLGSNTSIHEVLPLNENGFTSRSDTYYLLGSVARDSMTLLAA